MFAQCLFTISFFLLLIIPFENMTSLLLKAAVVSSRGFHIDHLFFSDCFVILSGKAYLLFAVRCYRKSENSSFLSIYFIVFLCTFYRLFPLMSHEKPV